MGQPRGVTPEPCGPGQESVWDYPRPPLLVREEAQVEVVFGGVVVCRAPYALLIKETSHPPTYYLPPESWRDGALRPAGGRSVCEWKGVARYFDVVAGDAVAPSAAWAYPHPLPAYAELAGFVSVYPDRMDAVTVDGEQVRGQDGGFYGGWITSRVVGPFKGGPGSRFW